MTPPNEIPFSSIVLGERGRTAYLRITELAQSILDNGLIQPLVLVPLLQHLLNQGKCIWCGWVDNGRMDRIQMECPNADLRFGLDAGGRRYHALKLMLDRGEWDGVLHHAVTSDPLHPGYILKGEAFCTPLQRVMTEIAENLDRDDPDWRDQTRLIVKAYKLSQTEAHANGENILMRDFGAMIGVEYMKVRSALTIHDDLIINPERYKDVTSIRGALTKLLDVNKTEILKLQATKSMQEGPKLVEQSPSVSVQSDSEPEKEKSVQMNLSGAFVHCDSLDYMARLRIPTFDHIVTDPDYGVSVERLEAGVSQAEAGVLQKTIEESLHNMESFIAFSWTAIRDNGFLVFWYDLDHHEKLQTFATDIGFRVQRWPLIWVKTDYRSNAAPGFNFTKNIEYAMVCRKPNAVLAQAQNSSVFNCSSGTTTRDFGHPFAKPIDVWKWIYSAITIKGQTTYDPFLGSGSAAVAAAQFGLKPVGSESDEGHYANAIMNLQNCYKKLIGGNVVFT